MFTFSLFLFILGFVLAAAYLMLGNMSEAIKDCRKAIELDPKNAKAMVR